MVRALLWMWSMDGRTVILQHARVAQPHAVRTTQLRTLALAFAAPTLLGLLAFLLAGCRMGDSRPMVYVPPKTSDTTLTGAGIQGAPSAQKAQGNAVAVPESPPPGPSESSDDDPVRQMAEAVCDHALVCGKLGGDGRFATRDTCVDVAVRKENQRLAGPECGGAVVPDKAAACVQEVRRTPCGHGPDVTACAPSALCGR